MPLEHPGLGIAHFYYLPLCLIALATDLMGGLLAGALAAAVYCASVFASPRIPSSHALTAATGIRLVTFALVGALVGLYASRNRQLVERLRGDVARDFVTGIGNAHAFDDELSRRCADGAPFTLLLLDVDGLKAINDVHGHAAGNVALRHVGETLAALAGDDDVAARVGGDEFALITTAPPNEAIALADELNVVIAAESLTVTAACTSAPQDGSTATGLFHKADDRLFTAKLLRANRISLAV